MRFLILILAVGGLVHAASPDLPLEDTFGSQLRHEAEIRDRYAQADAEQRRMILHELATSPRTQAARLAFDMNRDAEPAATAAMLQTLAGQPQAVPLYHEVEHLTSHRDPQIQAAALRTLGSLKDMRAFDKLITMIGHTDISVAAGARDGLQQLTGEDFGANTRVWSEWASEKEQKIASSLPGLIEQLDSDQPRQVALAAHQVLQWEHHHGLVAELLAPLLEHHDPAIAAFVQNAMALRDDPQATFQMSRHDPQALLAARSQPEPQPVAAAPSTSTRQAQLLASPANDGSWYGMLSMLAIIATIGGWLLRLRLKRQGAQQAVEDTRMIRNRRRVSFTS
ncbi:MAG: HEAT repeat domain-containing protein [Planctomycetota bacterium]